MITQEQIISSGSWIWSSGAENTLPDSYGAFRRKFDLQKLPEKLFICIAADSDFSLYVNGSIVPGNQFSDYPHSKSYTCFDVTSLVRQGSNCIAVLVHYIGDDFLRDIKGYPGLWAVIHDGREILETTSSGWLCRPAPGFRSGEQIKFTVQLGFCATFDAREEDADSWIFEDYDDSNWQHAQDVTEDYDRTLTERPLPCLTDRPYQPAELVQTGFLFRLPEQAETPSAQMYSDYLREMPITDVLDPGLLDTYIQHFEVYSVLQKCVFLPDGSGLPFKFRAPEDKTANGYYVIVDLGRETTGFIGFDVSCSAGTVIDYALGEHLNSGKVRSRIGNRNLSDRYICREGVNRFQLRTRRCAGRYLELHFTEAQNPPEIRFAGVAEQSYPLENETVFSCPDPLRMRTYSIAVDTLKNCMHEHYEDCPWREQALYAYDSRNQALYGYHVWGNYRFAEVSFDLLAKSMRPDGFLALTAPGEFYITIPNFCLAWISEVYEYYWYSGDPGLFIRNAQVVRQLLDNILAKRTANGLYTPGKGKGIWNFTEWVNGLSSGEAEEQAPFNIYLYEALLKADKLFRITGIEAPDYAEKARELGRIIEEKFYLAAQKCYASVTGNDAGKLLHEHTQALMLFNDLVPQEKISGVLENIREKRLIACTYSSMPFLIRALMRIGETQDYAAQRVSEAFDRLTLLDSTTLWENPPEDATCAGAESHCHGWSSLPVYFAKRYILGVKPLEAGFKKFTVTPWCGELLRASGEIPTPCGNIKVSWKQNGDRIDLQVDHPAELQYVPTV